MQANLCANMFIIALFIVVINENNKNAPDRGLLK